MIYVSMNCLYILAELLERNLQTTLYMIFKYFRSQILKLRTFSYIITRKNINNQFSSVAQSCLCDPMNYSTPGLPVHHQLPEFTQIHVHRVSDAIQPSHPLSSPSHPAPNPSQHQGIFQ